MPKAQVLNLFQLEQLKKRKEYLIALILLFVIIIVWIGVSIFASQQQLGISPADKQLAQPIKPTLNVEVLDVIQQKTMYIPAELADFPIFAQAEDEFGNQFLLDIRELDEFIQQQSRGVEQPTQAEEEEGDVDSTESGATQRQDIDLSQE